MRRQDDSRPLDPGSLREKIVFRRAVKTQDDIGQDITTWTDLITMWMEVRAMQGRELEIARQTWPEAQFKLRGWYPSVVIHREDRALWGERVLDILDAEDPGGRRREIAMVAREFTK